MQLQEIASLPFALHQAAFYFASAPVPSRFLQVCLCLSCVFLSLFDFSVVMQKSRKYFQIMTLFFNTVFFNVTFCLYKALLIYTSVMCFTTEHLSALTTLISVIRMSAHCVQVVNMFDKQNPKNGYNSHSIILCHQASVLKMTDILAPELQIHHRAILSTNNSTSGTC